MSKDQENFRGVHAIELLTNRKGYTIDSLIQLAHDPFLPAFKALIPGLVKAYDASPKKELKEAIEVFRNWDYKTSKESIAMTLAHFYGTLSYKKAIRPTGLNSMELVEYWGSDSPNTEKLAVFEETINTLNDDFGTWKMSWGEVNRYQRLNGDVKQAFNDSLPSEGVGFASGTWGALAAYGARYTAPGAKKIYGTRGNSFVAAVEFGDKVKAKTILAGGQSGDPTSPHFNDQTEKYLNIDWKDAAFYREDVLKRAQETYSPGKRK
jgi:acyl-homoserine lactone acylase PvdQ